MIERSVSPTGSMVTDVPTVAGTSSDQVTGVVEVNRR